MAIGATAILACSPTPRDDIISLQDSYSFKECYSDFDCSGQLVCVDNRCVEDYVEKPVIEQTSIDGINVKSGETNQEGKIYFVDDQTGEEVIYSVKDFETNSPISNAKVTFIDGDGFEGFATRKNGFMPSFEIFPHNSSHEAKLQNSNTVNYTKFDQYRYDNPEEEFIIPLNKMIKDTKNM